MPSLSGRCARIPFVSRLTLNHVKAVFPTSEKLASQQEKMLQTVKSPADIDIRQAEQI